MPYCPECWTEFVAGIGRCSDCDGPLTAGDLPRQRPVPEADPPADGGAAAAIAAIDTLLDEVPGDKAELVAEALRLEGVTCRLECGRIVQHRGPGQPPSGPLAVTLPVKISVAAADLEPSREILASLANDDLVGDAWLEEGEDAPGAPVVTMSPDEAAEAVETAPELRAEGANTWLIALLVVGVLVVLFMLSR